MMSLYRETVGVRKKPVNIESEGDQRFLVRAFADRSKERLPIVKLPRKPSRYSYRKLTFDKGKKKRVSALLQLREDLTLELLRSC